MWMNIGLILAGVILLERGATWFVRGSSILAGKMHISELAIGLTVVAFGTSAPELVVNSFASHQGNFDIVFGNIIGSNIFNLFVILSIAGLITPMKVQSGTAWKEIPFSLLAVLLLLLLANDPWIIPHRSARIGVLDSLVLLLAFGLFLFYAFRQLKSEPGTEPRQEGKEEGLKTALLVSAGLAGLVLGGKLVVDHAADLATEIGISEKYIGLFIVAPGTSLPELATSVVAAIRRNNDIAVGNIIGSNIFNILFIIPVSALIHPLAYDAGFNMDLAFLALGTVILFLAMYTGKRKEIDRWEAFILLGCYIAYVLWMVKQ